MMKRTRHTPEQVIRKLREADRLLAEGSAIGEVCRHLEVSEATYHRWRTQFGGMKADDVKRLRELERENTRLKRIVADQALALSERRACRYVAQHRSTQRREPTVVADDQALRAALRLIAASARGGAIAARITSCACGAGRSIASAPSVCGARRACACPRGHPSAPGRPVSPIAALCAPVAPTRCGPSTSSTT